jgi:hypothetical protein
VEVSIVLTAIKLALDALKGVGGLRSRDRKQIESEALKIIEIASRKDVEQYDPKVKSLKESISSRRGFGARSPRFTKRSRPKGKK